MRKDNKKDSNRRDNPKHPASSPIQKQFNSQIKLWLQNKDNSAQAGSLHPRLFFRNCSVKTLMRSKVLNPSK